MVYAAARKSFDYSEYLCQHRDDPGPHQPTATERAKWLVAIVPQLQMVESYEVRVGAFALAIQTRELIRPLMDEMGTMLGDTKQKGQA